MSGTIAQVVPARADGCGSGRPTVEPSELERTLDPGVSTRFVEEDVEVSVEGLRVTIPAGTTLRLQFAPLRPFWFTLTPDRPLAVHREGGDQDGPAYTITELVATLEAFPSPSVRAETTVPPSTRDAPALRELASALVDSALAESTRPLTPELTALVELMTRASGHLHDYWRARLGSRWRPPPHVGISGQPGDESAAPPDGVLVALSELAHFGGGRGLALQALAHEFGHHVLYSLGLDSDARHTPIKRIELQADCLAGAWLAQAVRDGLLSEADYRDAHRRLGLVEYPGGGGNRGTARSHGTGSERQRSLQRGFSAGRRDPIRACVGVR
jgi:hypothetical protein